MFTPSIEDVESATEGRYRVERLLATGGMGAVYLGHNPELGSVVAIKVLHPEIAQHGTLLERFKREAALSASLSHPNIVPVFEFAVRNAIAFLVMPFIEGETLAAQIERRGPLSVAEVVDLLNQVGAALNFAHGRSIVHRDIKPSNILLEQETGRWLVTDFGIAHIDSGGDTALTKTGATIGTPAYMAPEQARGAAKIDERADLYSLAVVAFEALTGVLPDTLAPNDQIARDLRRRVPALTAAQASTLTTPLAQSPDERPDSVEQWLEGLRSPRRFPKAVKLSVGIALAAAAALGLTRLFPTSYSPSSSPPTLAVLPFTVTGSPTDIDLSSVLPLAFEWHVQRLPEYRVVGVEAMRDRERQRFGGEVPPIDQRLELAGELGATHLVLGWADASDGRISLRVLLHDVTTGRQSASAESEGSLDSLDAVVSNVVANTLAARVATARSGVAPVLPDGLDAITAYFAGDAAFRAADYTSATAFFDSVISRDSTYPLAHFKRMLALVQASRPTEVGTQTRSALAATINHKERLDAAHRSMLEAYEILLTEGNLAGAERAFRQVVSRFPDLVDAWFVLGFVQYKFGALLGIPVQQPRAAFHEVVRRDPLFAAAHGQLALIAIDQDDRQAAESRIAEYLAIDSVSAWAALARSVDSLLFRPTLAPLVTETFAERSSEYLEMIALSAGTLSPPGGTRPIAKSAARALWRRALTQRERDVAFRMLMADELGSSRIESAQRLLAEAVRRRVSQEELDRWVLLGTLLPDPLITDRVSINDAAQRLMAARVATGDRAVESLWLAARWYRAQPDDPVYQRVVSRLNAAAEALSGSSATAAALQGDLDALALLDSGDSVGALTRWESATSSYDVERLTFGLVASLWPLRLERAKLAAELGQHETVIGVTESFVRMAGFIDQVAWSEAIVLRARAQAAVGRYDAAVNTYRALLRVLATADGPGALRREAIQRELMRLQS